MRRAPNVPRPLVLAAVFALAATTVWSCSKPAPGAVAVPHDAEADKAAIRAVVSRAVEVSKAGDAAGWAALFADGGVYMRPNGEEIATRAGLQEFAGLYMGQYNSRVQITPVEVEVFGDWGFARTSVKGEVQGKVGGDPLPDPLKVDGKEIGIYRRQQDGSWKLWRLIGNSNLP
jgi:uncharacterized protein (TIGR02246 family)